jgi:GntR family transcriptional repressor for pyruvate dehydrogenase complex
VSETLKRVVLSDVIADRIQEQILEERLAPGTSLPTEAELMAQYGVGRSAVREAAKVLVERGLVEVRPGKGMTVSAPLGDVVTKQLVTHLKMSRTSPAQLFEVREIIDTQIARSAARNHTDEDIAYLREVLREADEVPDDPDAYIPLDLAFHQGLARATQNPFYSLVVSAIFLLIRDPSFSPLRYSSVRELTQAEHRAIVDAIESGDEELAVKNSLGHSHRVRSDMENLFAKMRRSGGEADSVRKGAGERSRRSPSRRAKRT